MMDYVESISVSHPSFSTFNKIKLKRTSIINVNSFDILFTFSTEIGQLYAIAGNSQKVGLCQYIKEYNKMSQVEKRGIAGAYKKGCGCEVSSK
jgi:Tissue inhibitor of metalloproteinase